jgi:hypothetical protein
MAVQDAGVRDLPAVARRPLELLGDFTSLPWCGCSAARAAAAGLGDYAEDLGVSRPT